jgi:hypothetical protein
MLPQSRTESMGSRVLPAVTRNLGVRADCILSFSMPLASRRWHCYVQLIHATAATSWRIGR